VKIVVLFESMTGNTRRASELIGGAALSRGNEVSVRPITAIDYHELADADLVFLGTWTDGLVLFGQRPGRAGRLKKLPVLDRKPVALFVTYAVNAGKVLDRFATLAEGLGARVVGQHQFKRNDLDAGLDAFVDTALAAAGGQVLQPRSTA
jgi:hypothetical protein